VFFPTYTKCMGRYPKITSRSLSPLSFPFLNCHIDNSHYNMHDWQYVVKWTRKMMPFFVTRISLRMKTNTKTCLTYIFALFWNSNKCMVFLTQKRSYFLFSITSYWPTPPFFAPAAIPYLSTQLSVPEWRNQNTSFTTYIYVALMSRGCDV